MAAAADPAVCPGCGARLPPTDGPVHAYMLSSPACWAAYGEVLAREYQSPDLMLVHRLSVDAWAVQHPGDGSRRAIQSVGLHLARLMIQLEEGLHGSDAHDRMLAFAARKAEIQPLEPPARWSNTVADFVDACAPPAHIAAVQAWAAAVWGDMAVHHALIRRWATGGPWRS